MVSYFKFLFNKPIKLNWETQIPDEMLSVAIHFAWKAQRKNDQESWHSKAYPYNKWEALIPPVLFNFFLCSRTWGCSVSTSVMEAGTYILQINKLAFSGLLEGQGPQKFVWCSQSHVPFQLQ